MAIHQQTTHISLHSGGAQTGLFSAAMYTTGRTLGKSRAGLLDGLTLSPAKDAFLAGKWTPYLFSPFVISDREPRPFGESKSVVE